MSGLEVLAIIPARSGSKSIPHKNIRLINGKPLLAYSVEHALAAKTVTRTILSTDSKAYADIGREFGAEVPFLRPAEYSLDESLDFDVFYHALSWLQSHENYRPDICVHLRPTHPIRDPQDIDRMVQILIENPQLDSVRSIAIAQETPFKMWFRQPDGLLSPVVKSDLKDAYNMPRQILPVAYLQNASIDVVRTQAILESRSMNGKQIYGYIMDYAFDIDTEEEFQKALAVMERRKDN